MTNPLQAMRQQFENKLPASLGSPYIVNTKTNPYIFIAFYAANRHELTDNSIVVGNEFRLAHFSNGFKDNQRPLLAGILGIYESDPSFIAVVALKCKGTQGSDFAPYGSTIRQLFWKAIQQHI